MSTEAKGRVVIPMDSSIDSNSTNGTTEFKATRLKPKSNAPPGFY